MRPVENGAWASFVSYIVAGIAFYQNHVENAGEPHSPSRSYLLLVWSYSGDDKYKRDREKSS